MTDDNSRVSMTPAHQNPIKRFGQYLRRNPKELAALLFLGLLLVGVLTAWATIAYRRHTTAIAIAKERAQFQKAETTVARIADGLTQQAGVPIKRVNEDECSRPNRELGQGPLSCMVGLTLDFGVRDWLMARSLVSVARLSLINSAQNIILDSNKVLDGLPLEEPTDAATSAGFIAQFSNSGSKMQCSSYYEYMNFEVAKTRNYTDKKSKQQDKFLVISITCSAISLLEYYTLR